MKRLMFTRKFYVLMTILIGLAVRLQSQDQRLLVMAEDKDPVEFFTELSLQSGINIIYSDDVISRLPLITLQLKGVTVEEILAKVLHGSDIEYSITGDQIVLFQKAEQEKYTISGMVRDSVSGEPLIFAFVHDEISGKSTSTNNYGYYSLTLPKGEIVLIAGYLNYIQKRVHLNFNRNQTLSLLLQSSGELPTVIINGDEAEKNSPIVPSAKRIGLLELQSTMNLGGSSDLYRAADFIPGVHTGTDGVGGIHVRGGGNDQNLILMDGVPVYHPNHLLGIVSVFNYQVLQSASIYKANFPSRFSGRLSSVMDVRTREGNLHNWSLSGNVAVSEIGLTAEGPVVSDKISVLLSGRLFLPGFFIPDLTRKYKKRNGVGGYADVDYFDFNGKINWFISEKDRLYLSTYLGRDHFNDQTIIHRDVLQQNGTHFISDETFDKRLNWSNRTGVLRWNHILTDNIFANFILSTSYFELQSVDRSDFKYRYPGTTIGTLKGFDTKEFKSGISDITGKIELDIRPSQDHQFSTGCYAIHYTFKPKSVTFNEESQIDSFYLNEGLLEDENFSSFEVNALEAGIYFEDKWQASEKIIVSSGVHVSGFYVQGIHYLDPQLRMSVDYALTQNLAFNVGYSRMAQYLHNLTSSSIGLPTDLWVPSTALVSPALADQYSLSGRWKLTENLIFDFSSYMKYMRSLISYQEGASFLLKGGLIPSSIVDAANWESKITDGSGNASGVELQLNYSTDRMELNLNGTWSKSYRTFEDINSGKPFPDRYDRRWSSTFSALFKLGDKWTCGANYLFGTGIAITLAESKFYDPQSIFPQIGINYSERNGYRLPPYHRLDLSVKYQLAERKKFNHSLTLNLYNVYNRTNPFYITLVQDPISEDLEFRQFSLFKFFPSISYRFALL